MAAANSADLQVPIGAKDDRNFDSAQLVVAHSAGTGWRTNDTTYRRGTGVFAARFPSDDPAGFEQVGLAAHVQEALPQRPSCLERDRTARTIWSRFKNQCGG
jgi:hypothetical protein